MHVFKRSYLKVPEKAHPLVKELFKKMIAQRASISDVSDRSGVSRETISAWRYRNNCNLATFEACANSVGYELRLVKKYRERE